MSEAQAWNEPSGHAVVRRRWTYAPPPWVMYEAVVDEMSVWMYRLTTPAMPNVSASRQPDRVLLKPWVDHPVTAIELLIEPDGGPGSAITVIAYADVSALIEEDRIRVRHRLGTIFGSGLRLWVDQPH